MSTVDRRRAATTVVVIAVALLVATRGLSRHTPGGIVALGFLDGCANALLAVGIVLVYRSVRVVNFAQAALGALGGYLTFVVGGFFHWPLPAAIAAGIVASAALGVVVDIVFMQRFFTAPRLVLTVVTIVLADLLAGTKSWVDRLPGVHRAMVSLTNQKLITDAQLPAPFAHFSFTIAPLRFGARELIAVALGVTALGALAVFFRVTRQGTALRAVAENAERALLLGINVRALSTLVWAIAATLGGVASIISGLTTNFAGTGSPRPEVLLPALTAGVLARMTSLPVAAAGALALSIVRQSVLWSYPRSSSVDLAFLLVIAAGLVVQRRRMTRSEDVPASSWEAMKEQRAIPRELAQVPFVQRSRRVIVGTVLLAAIVAPLAGSPSQTNLFALILIQAIVALSLVVLTGWAGQVSLGQFAFVALAAAAGGTLTGDGILSFWIALPVVAVLTGAFAALIGLPALRLRGAFLAVTTLAFAVAVQHVLFGSSWLQWLIPERVSRPHLFFLSFSEERSYYYLCLAVLVVCAVVVMRLRASRPGRALIALRDNEPGVESFGINLVRMRLAGFALSGALCGIAGVLFVHHQRALDAGSYQAATSVGMFVMAMLGGITSVSGALIGAAYVGIVNFVLTEPVFRQLLSSGTLLVLLMVAPGGLAQLVYGLRDAVLRIVATREQIPVLSLFEHVDAAALADRRATLGERSPGRGLDAARQRYALPSELYEEVDA